jgi:hypothetical protein
MTLYKIAWLVWVGGTVLIVLSWSHVVSAKVGWAGFVIAVIGVGLSAIPHLQAKKQMRPSPPDDKTSS